MIDVDVADLEWTKEGFARAALTTPPQPPARITREQFAVMTASERTAYNLARDRWHQDLEFLDRVPQVSKNIRRLNRLIISQPNRTSSKRGIWIDGESTLGKTALVRYVLHQLYRERTDCGANPYQPNGNERVPVVWLPLPARPTLKAVNERLSDYMNMPRMVPRAKHREEASYELAATAAAWAVACGVEVIVIDDVQSLANRYSDSDQTSNHIRHLMNLIPAVFILIGADLRKDTTLLNDGKPLSRSRTQSAKRFNYMQLTAFGNRSDEERAEWQLLLRSIEKRIIVFGDTKGALANHADFIHTRTGGSMGSLIGFVRDATGIAIHEGDDVITKAVLEETDTDYASDIRS